MFRASSDPLSTGADGVFAAIPWTSESASPSKFGFAHSTTSTPALITCERRGSFLIVGSAKITGGLWSEFVARVEVDRGAGFVALDSFSCSGGAIGLLDANTGAGSCAIACPVDLTKNDVVRVSCAAIGQTSVGLVLGEEFTWLEIRPLR